MIPKVLDNKDYIIANLKGEKGIKKQLFSVFQKHPRKNVGKRKIQ